MNAPNLSVDFFFEKENPFQPIMKLMRDLALSCNLNETLKWGCPCYQLNNKNVILIHVFKEYCAYLFFKGALLENDSMLLVQQSENTQATRQIRLSTISEFKKNKAAIKQTILNAINVEQQGLKVTLKKTNEFPIVEEFNIKLLSQPSLKKAFNALTPGRQRAYLLYFASAKLAKTREARIEKHIPDIFKGRGLNDEK